MLYPKSFNPMRKTFLLAALGVSALTAAADTITLGTGVDASSNPLAVDSLEQNYVMTFSTTFSGVPIGGASLSAVVARSSGIYGTLIGDGAPWVANPTDARWISPWTQGTELDPWLSDAVGYYDYRRAVCVAGLTTISVTVESATDNPGWAYVNGVQVAEINTMGNLSSFNLALNPGLNTIDFVVQNELGNTPYGNPSGLLVLSSAFDTCVPEPGALTLMTLSGGLLLVLRWRGWVEH